METLSNTQSNEISPREDPEVAMSSELDRDSVCAPIRSLEELANTLTNPPQWLKHLKDRVVRSPTIVQNSSLNCHKTNRNIGNIVKRFDSYLTPKTLVCHDMKNGYLDDRYLAGYPRGNGYTFFRWAQIDIFVYFSHHFITVPPLAWINKAHANGVKILGTIITENDGGKLLCEGFLKDYKKFADDLIQLALIYKLDGWLLNIENELETTDSMKKFVSYITENIHASIPESMIIWYDSVIEDGKLSWQNELNEKNRCFFDVCDGIFLNYTYKEHNLFKSYLNAQHRVMDVYVGIDVFGRNTYGGGKFNCHIAAEKIRMLNMSIAIFAQGWVHETLQPEPQDTFHERFMHKDNSFWRSLWPFLYTHPINTLFNTSFYIGTDKNQYALHEQELQLSRYLHNKNICDYDLSVSNLTNQCNCMQLHTENDNATCVLTKNNDSLAYFHQLFICDIQLNGKYILYTATKAVDESTNDLINLILLLRQTGTIRKIVCNAIETEGPEDNISLQQIKPIIDGIRIDSPYRNVSDATFRYYELHVKNPCRLLEISAEIVKGNSVELRAIGISKLKEK
ncbi:PREDICTED: cytosolic endo-beta-N-acetylglucosaminidase [Nicrophorus vespilloides]|uniref:Cytosolic endo-beta-N-acetylglucosaminidase n=1 Tax=Nicrophorus vespilloides TaxID=110193 RepID=A0ABM1NJC4_NICVS|nr:PREDICTED: cytosolic endo-beta-N-acetylglucosaminidase [Nicrophorus vespilloides]